MKKLLCFSFVLSLLSVCQASPTYVDPIYGAELQKHVDDYKKRHYPYAGPQDNVVVTGCDAEHRIERDATTLGWLAQTSDVIGIGVVTQTEQSNFVVRVETALAGCAKGQHITLSWAFLKYGDTFYKHWKDAQITDHSWVERAYVLREPPLEYLYGIEKWRKPKTPDEGTRVVFAAYANSDGEKTETSFPVVHYLLFNERSWWPVNRDNGLLTKHFKKMVQATRVKPNGEKYFALCRDGVFMDSNRVKEDSFYDMRTLIKNAGKHEAQFMFDDPLLPSEHKAFLRHLYPDVKNKNKIPELPAKPDLPVKKRPLVFPLSIAVCAVVFLHFICLRFFLKK